MVNCTRSRRVAIAVLAMLVGWGCDDGATEGPAADANLASDLGADLGVDIGSEDMGRSTDADPADAEVLPDAMADAAADAGPDAAIEACGDGVLEDPEDCDDGNLEAGDGCDPTCRLEIQRHDEAGPDPLELRFNRAGVAQVRFELSDDADVDRFAFELPQITDLVIELLGEEAQTCEGAPTLAFGPDEDSTIEIRGAGASGCPVAVPGSAPQLAELSAGRYLVSASLSLPGSGSFTLRISQEQPLEQDAPCHFSGVLGRCAEALVCGDYDAESGVGVCGPLRCGDGLRAAGEACDDGNTDGADQCDLDCTLNGPTEAEPNDTPAQAGRMGDALTPLYGQQQVAHRLSAADDVDVFAFELDEPSTLRVLSRDGFLACPGALRHHLWSADGEVLQVIEIGCDRWRSVDLEPGRYFVAISTDDPAVFDVPLLTFATVTPLGAPGASCAGVDAACVATAYCADEGQDPICVAHRCGDGLVGPDEACDDGNIDDGDGCSAVCEIEPILVAAPGSFEGSLLEGGRDVYALELPVAANFSAETSDGAGGCPGDTELVLAVWRDEIWREIARHDDLSPDNRCSRIERRLVAGRYRLTVQHLFGEALPQYTVDLDWRVEGGEGAACEDDSGCDPNLRCAEQICTSNRCGDGVVDPEEQCDDGNPIDGDGCDAACQIEPSPILGSGDYPGATEAGARARFRLSLDAPQIVDLRVLGADGDCPFDTFIELYTRTDQGLERLAADDDGGPGTCSVLSESLAPGEYEIHVFGLLGAPLDAFVLTARVLEARAIGTPCERSGSIETCPDARCLFGAGDGVGLCGHLGERRAVAEPNQTIETAFELVPGQEARGRLTPVGANTFDLFRVSLDRPTQLRVFTSDGSTGCDGDTVLFRINSADFAAGGSNAIFDGAFLAINDDTDRSACSALAEALDAGVHYFMVANWQADPAPFDYVLTVLAAEPKGEGAACDASELQTICRADGPMVCVDDDGDGDGICVQP